MDIQTIGVVTFDFKDTRFCLFVFLLYVPVNSYGHYGMVSSPNHTLPGQA